MSQFFSTLVNEAIELALQKHQGQMRKHPENMPYASHVVSAAFILQRAGFADEVVAAGLLHDTLEDCDVTYEDLAERFGKEVADLVDGVTEEKGLSWDERKAAYREKLKKGSEGVLAVAAADHIHNTRSLARGLKSDENMMDYFKSKLSERLEHERACLKIIKSGLQNPIVSELEESVNDLLKLQS